ncbi:MAG: response regulator [Marmoricola sp.]
MIRLLIVDDEALIRDGLRAIAEVESDIEVVGEAGNGQDALHVIEETSPNVVLMDIRMPVLDGITAMREIGSTPNAPRVIMLTTFGLDEYVYDAINAGASGFLLKDSHRHEIIHAIRTVATGDALVAPAVTRALVQRLCRPVPETGRQSVLEPLTEREREVLMLLGGGYSNAEIARHLVIGESTVKTHVSRVLTKLGLRDRAQAVVIAYRTGLVSADAE